jgi:hypothetical protein
MKTFFVPRAWFVVVSLVAVFGGSAVVPAAAADQKPSTKNKQPSTKAEVFRPEPGMFPPADKAKAYDGQLVFVDHANRRGSLRVPGEEVFHSTAPTPFAMLPYGMIRQHGAPADLRDIPLGTMLHGRFYLPPDPELSAVPVITKASVTRPAENHAILLEDEPSFCLREGKVWKLQEVELTGKDQGMILAHRESKDGAGKKEDARQMTIDAATRFWRGSEVLGIEDLIAEGLWPAKAKKSLDGQAVQLGLAWKPAGTWSRRVERFHITDIWLNETALQRATQRQTAAHRELIRSRWMPAFVDAVEYGKYGEATVTATLFGGMDPELYADFKKGGQGQMAPSEANLKHMDGKVSHSQRAIKGSILDLTNQDKAAPPGSSGIQIRMKLDVALEGFRPGRIVRIRPMNWPNDSVPREEYTNSNREERFPSPDIFPKY